MKASNVGKKLKLKASLPKLEDGYDGLQDIAGEVLDDQSRTRVLVLVVSCDEVNIKEMGEITEGRLSIAHIEAVVDPDQESHLRQFMKQRQEERTGEVPLFDSEDDL